MVHKIALLLFVALIGCKGSSQEKGAASTSPSEEEGFEVTKSEEEWRKELTEMEFYVLRKEATENPFTSELLKNDQKGVYTCAGCGTPLFQSEHKYDSGTGWPSFYQEIEGNVAYDTDYKIGVARTEEHCAVCGGHLGHVFDDGPDPTGKRHCINGAALDFEPAQ